MTPQKVIVVCLMLCAFASLAPAQTVVTNYYTDDFKTVTTRTVTNYYNDDFKMHHDGGDDVRGITFQFVAEHRRMLNTDYDWYGGATVRITALIDKYNSAGLFLGGGGYRLKTGSFADTIADDPGVVQWGIVGRHTFTPYYTTIQPYVTAEIRFSWMFWDYNSTMTVGTDTVRYDGMETAEGLVGAGVAFHLPHASVFGEVDFGGMGTECRTDAGVRNNFFTDSAFVGIQVGVELSF